jgi:hypothetical protein
MDQTIPFPGFIWSPISGQHAIKLDGCFSQAGSRNWWTGFDCADGVSYLTIHCSSASRRFRNCRLQTRRSFWIVISPGSQIKFFVKRIRFPSTRSAPPVLPFFFFFFFSFFQTEMLTRDLIAHAKYYHRNLFVKLLVDGERDQDFTGDPLGVVSQGVHHGTCQE